MLLCAPLCFKLLVLLLDSMLRNYHDENGHESFLLWERRVTSSAPESDDGQETQDLIETVQLSEKHAQNIGIYSSCHNGAAHTTNSTTSLEFGSPQITLLPPRRTEFSESKSMNHLAQGNIDETVFTNPRFCASESNSSSDFSASTHSADRNIVAIDEAKGVDRQIFLGMFAGDCRILWL